VKSQGELQQVLRDHKEFIESSGKSRKQATLGSADLRDAWLGNITLSKAFLEEANFNCAALGAQTYGAGIFSMQLLKIIVLLQKS
jgi:uncharacterized protein YjbI with pentapeptide repeats